MEDKYNSLFFDIKSIDELDEKDINSLFDEYNKFNQTVYEFVLKYYKYIYSKKDYGTGKKIKMIEAHIISDIADNPDITANNLAKKWDRTPAFISKTLRSLENKGYIEQKTDENNRRFNKLILTKKGVELDFSHKKYDLESIIYTNSVLLERFSLEEIIKFRHFLKEYGDLIEKELLEIEKA